MKLTNYEGSEIRALRKKLGLNQHEFWQHFQTTQSGGSRYEAGRDIPAPVQMLLNIAVGTEGNSAAIVQTLRTLAKPPKKVNKPVKVPPKFGILP